MIRIDGYFFYQVGASLRPLSQINAEWKKGDIRIHIWNSAYWLDLLLNQSVFRLKTSRPKGNALLAVLRRIKDEYEKEGENLQEPVGFFDAYSITSGLTEFETVLSAELQFADLYLVTKKGGYDSTELAENGIAAFPGNLGVKVPEAISDAMQCGRCIAFELPTAAAFHAHRANEAVLHRYYDAVTGGAARPTTRTMGAYISKLRDSGAGEEKVLAALVAIKDLHRNPVVHPEDSLESIEEALALLGSIHSAMVHMLKAIPDKGI